MIGHQFNSLMLISRLAWLVYGWKPNKAIEMMLLVRTTWLLKTLEELFKYGGLWGYKKKLEILCNGNRNYNLAVDIPQGGSSHQLFPGQIWIGNVGFCAVRKLEGPTEKPLEQGGESTTNSAHMWATVVRGKHSHHHTIPTPLCHLYFPAPFPLPCTISTPFKFCVLTKCLMFFYLSPPIL